MKTKDINIRIDEFFNVRGFKKIKGPGFIFVKSNGVRTIHILIVTKAIPALDTFSLFWNGTTIYFDEIARITALKPKTVKNNGLNLGFGLTKQSIHNIKMGGGFHKSHTQINQLRKISYSFEQLDIELHSLYQDWVIDIDESIPDLESINNLLEQIPFEKGIERNTINGSLFVFKLLVYYCANNPNYNDYKDELIRQKEKFIAQEIEDAEIEYSRKKLKHLKAIIEQIEREKTISINA